LFLEVIPKALAAPMVVALSAHFKNLQYTKKKKKKKATQPEPFVSLYLWSFRFGQNDDFIWLLDQSLFVLHVHYAARHLLRTSTALRRDSIALLSKWAWKRLDSTSSITEGCRF
tara:strand:+ start:164 stop:505 length:342 start_codon:yes stop_codon:yes gene_type:complete